MNTNDVTLHAVQANGTRIAMKKTN
ncbi:MAG: hypothetical protein ACRC9Q_07290 [Bacteroidales bacterium]